MITALLVYCAISVFFVAWVTWKTGKMERSWKVETAVFVISIAWGVSMVLFIISLIMEKIKKK